MTQALHILRYGEPEGLVLADVPAPAPLAGEVAIEVHVAGVNYPDLLVVRGIYQNLASLPFSPGKEIAGIVRAVGDDVREFRIGDRVLAYVENGGYVEQIAVPAVLCHPVPENLDLADAIGLGLTFQTAHFALFARGQMKRGESVLVTGATGGVGISTVQLAKACGATVIAGCMTEAKAGFAREHGADHVIMLDRSDLEQTLKAEVAALTGGRGVDVVVDNLGNGIFEACLRALAWCGRIVVVGFAAGAPATLRSNYLLIKNISATGLHWSDYRDRVPEQVRDAQRDIFTLWRRGLLTSPVTDALRLEDAPIALRRIADRQVRGKIVLLTAGYSGRFNPSSVIGSG
ncbi:MAG: NADPH:quinone oxidoreductase family protein [Pseudorhodoplanes sp.]